MSATVSVDDGYVDTNQGRIYAKRWRPVNAAAATIVLLHDSLGCVELWRDFPGRLAQATCRDVIAYDRLGFGRSDPHPGTLTTRFVQDEAHGAFAAVKQHFPLNAFVAFGHSVGGGMAVGCAATHAESCRALVTESAQAFVEERTVQGIRDAQRAFAQPGQIERLAKYHGDKAAWVLSAWIDRWLALEFAAWNLDDTLHRVRCPALVMHGEQDEYGSPRHPARIAASVALRSTLQVFRDTGHVPHRERGEVVLDTVSRWLAAADIG
jgi:pimeloyl-ACP methyl ester carboxylesterase